MNTSFLSTRSPLYLSLALASLRRRPVSRLRASRLPDPLPRPIPCPDPTPASLLDPVRVTVTAPSLAVPLDTCPVCATILAIHNPGARADVRTSAVPCDCCGVNDAPVPLSFVLARRAYGDALHDMMNRFDS